MLAFCLLSNLMRASSSGECGLCVHECARRSVAWWVCRCGVVVAVVIVSLTNMISMSLFGAQSGRRVPGSVLFPDEADFPFPTFCVPCHVPHRRLEMRNPPHPGTDRTPAPSGRSVSLHPSSHNHRPHSAIPPLHLDSELDSLFYCESYFRCFFDRH